MDESLLGVAGIVRVVLRLDEAGRPNALVARLAEIVLGRRRGACRAESLDDSDQSVVRVAQQGIAADHCL